MTDTITAAAQEPTISDQAPILLSQIAGYVGHRTVGMGLRKGLIGALADAPSGVTADELADRLGLDPFYVSVWCRSAVAAGVCDRQGDTYRLAPHLDTMLLDTASPAYVGGVFTVLEQREMFGRFEEELATGERLWWDNCSAEWIAGVAGTGIPFYTRLIPGGLAHVRGLTEQLQAGGVVVDTACGAGAGLQRLAEAYPACQIVGVDGDQASLERAERMLGQAGMADRVKLVWSPLEDLALAGSSATLVINNISMHECRDIDRVTQNIADVLKPGGWFVISDFPFPDTVDGLRTIPGRIMSGIQFFEAQIDDQLLPRSYYDGLLDRHGFTEVGASTLTPMHALTYGRRPL